MTALQPVNSLYLLLIRLDDVIHVEKLTVAQLEVHERLERLRVADDSNLLISIPL